MILVDRQPKTIIILSYDKFERVRKPFSRKEDF